MKQNPSKENAAIVLLKKKQRKQFIGVKFATFQFAFIHVSNSTIR